MTALTPSNIVANAGGIIGRYEFDLALTNSYPTGGYTLTAQSLGLSRFRGVSFNETAGYTFGTNDLTSQPSSCLVIAYEGASGTTGATSGGTPSQATGASVSNGTSAVTGTAAAQTFTGTAPASALNIATPVFSGTGQSSAGQVITTTDTQTMTLNQCAGMWFVSATHGPYLIASNTAVAGAAAVLTIIGTAPTTDAGAYKILTGVTPAGTNAASASLTATAAAQTATVTQATYNALSTHTHTVGAAAGGEVTNGTDLSAVTVLNCVAYGY